MSKAKGYTDQRPAEIIALDNYLKGDKRTKKEAIELLSLYTKPTAKPQSYYVRVNSMAQGSDHKPTPTEISAIRQFLHCENNPHIYGQTIYDIGDIERKLNQLDRYLQSGYIDRVKAKQLIKDLKSLTTLQDPQLPE